MSRIHHFDCACPRCQPRRYAARQMLAAIMLVAIIATLAAVSIEGMLHP